MASSPVAVQKEILKTRMCSFHAGGRCSKGRACTFAHHKSELRPKLDLFKSRPCAAYERKGYCNEGNACRFAHGANDLRAPLPAEAEKSPTSADDSLAELACAASNRRERATKNLQQNPPTVLPAVDPSQMLLSTLAMQMQMQQACMAGTRVVAIMMPPQPVFAGNMQHVTSPFTAMAFANASSGDIHGQVVRESADQSSDTSVKTVHDPATTADGQAEPRKPKVTLSQTSTAHERSVSPDVVPLSPLASAAIPAQPSSDLELVSRTEDSGAKADSRVESVGSLRGYDFHLQLRDSENRCKSFSLASEDDGFLSDYSPRSNDEFVAPTPTSSCDIPILDCEAADDFWLREPDANLVYEKHTFLHVASPTPTASRRSRSSPCGTSTRSLSA